MSGELTGAELTVRIAAGLLLVAVNAFFVVSEFSLTRLATLPRNAHADDRRLRLAFRMTEELEIYLTGCQLGISASSVVLGVVAEPALTILITPALSWLPLETGTIRVVAVVVGVALIQLVHKIWGEQAPTYLGVERPVEVARWAAPALYLFTRLAYPIIFAGDGLAKLTLRLFGVRVTRSWTRETNGDEAPAEGTPRARVSRALAGSSMRPSRRREVERAAELDEIPVRNVATPASEVSTVEASADLTALVNELGRATVSRVPLVRGGLDDCVGILYVPAVLSNLPALQAGTTTLEDVAVPPLDFPADTSIAEAIDRLQQSDQEIALLRDGGHTVGIVTTTDCFEAIVGQLFDPFDVSATPVGVDPVRARSAVRAVDADGADADQPGHHDQ